MNTYPVFNDAEIALSIKKRQNISEESLFSMRQDRALQLEAMIGESSEFLPYCFLQRGQFAGRSVGRIVVRIDKGIGPEVIGYGTGFLITPSILMTNNHVLPTPQTCVNSIVQFNYEIDMLGNEITPIEFNLSPDTFFLTNDKSMLDFTLVGVKVKNDEVTEKSLGYISLNGSKSKIITGEPVNIIEHPQGRRKEIVVQKNEITGFFEGGFIHYAADTLQGSSGSPVFNNQWVLVALHHSGVYKRNEKGEAVLKDGMPVYEANEGVRISSIVEYLKSEAVVPEQKAILDTYIL
jgi:endonuclease G, mitochondrial